MRLTTLLYKNARAPQDPNKVPFKELYPLSLKNHARIQKVFNLEDKCLFEMTALFTCWKKNDFDDNACSEFIKKFESCNEQLKKSLNVNIEIRKKEEPTPYTRPSTERQLRYLLRQYPTV